VRRVCEACVRRVCEACVRRVCGGVPHVLQPVHGQQVRGHGEVQLVDEGRHLGGRVQQVDDGAAQIVQLSLKRTTTDP